MLRLGIDVDGVIADFQSAFRTLAERELGIAAKDVESELTKADVDRLWKVVAAQPELVDPRCRPTTGPGQPGLHAAANAAAGRRSSSPAVRPAPGNAVQLQTQVWLERLRVLSPLARYDAGRRPGRGRAIAPARSPVSTTA